MNADSTQNGISRAVGAMLALAWVAAASPVLAVPPMLVAGQVERRRPSWKSFQLTKPVVFLDSEDWLRVRGKKQATLFCSDFSRRTVPAGRTLRVHNICPEVARSRGRRGSSTFGSARGGSDPLIPYIISPRKTAILTDKPVFSWNAVPGARRYRVRLRGPDGILWQQDVVGTSVVYPRTPALQPGIAYAPIVEADTGTTSLDEGIAGLGFQRLEADKIEKIQTEVQQIVTQDLPDEAKALLRQARRHLRAADSAVVGRGPV